MRRWIQNTIIITGILILASSVSCGLLHEGSNLIAGRFTSEDDMDAAVETVDRFFDLLMQNDYQTAYEYISSSDREDSTLQDFVYEFRDVTDIVKVEINWVEVKSNVALVGIDIVDSYDGQQKMYKDLEVSLVKEEDESWKIVFWD